MYQQIINELKPYRAKLIAVSKTKSNADIKALYHKGQIAFGENKVQELVEKYEALPKDIQWHLIGHLQTNKVKLIVPFVHLIHSVDSLKLFNEIHNEAAKIFRTVNILLQLSIDNEDTKFGLELQEAYEILDFYFANKEDYQYINIIGVMGMASYTDNEAQVNKEFYSLKNMFINIKETYFPFNDSFKEISMGMSSDYKLALENGATIVRIGSLLFGTRN